MQETNKEHRKQQERKEINSEVSKIEHAWKYIMNSGQRARNSKRSSSSIMELKEINKAPGDINTR